MKLLHSLLFALTSILAVVLADTENYQVFAKAATEAGLNFSDHRRKYAMYEYWVTRGALPDCGGKRFGHVRVVVGQIRQNFPGHDFVGIAYDLIINQDTGKTEADSEPWKANYYVKDGVEQRVSTDNTYYGGYTVATGMSDAVIQKIGEKYCADFPDYSLIRNNCLSFAQNLVNQIYDKGIHPSRPEPMPAD